MDSWSGMRKYLEREALAEALRGRVRYNCTAYVGMDGCHIFELFIDGKLFKQFSWETVNAYFIRMGYAEKARPMGIGDYWADFWTLLERHPMADREEYTDGEFCDALEAYRNGDIQASVRSPNALVRMFALLDRRVGRRTLAALREEMRGQPEWLRALYTLRAGEDPGAGPDQPPDQRKEKPMEHITTRQFQPLSDVQIVWDLMVEDYEPRFANGVAAPFFEYALTSSWLDKRFLYLNRLWFDGDRLVGVVFYENPVSLIFFHLRAGYEALAAEMIAYADEAMPGAPGEKELVLFPGQKALAAAAEARGYRLDREEEEMALDFRRGALEYPLPEGFRFVPPEECDALRVAICCWKGFDNEAEKGPFVNWDAEDSGTDWNPQKSYRNILSCMTAPPPHATFEYNVVIADAKGDYACYSGMWWVPENRLAYMEPLCTIPEYRHRGLAAAALSEHYRRMKALGAEWMTGGGNDFYRKIGYNDAIRWRFWKRPAP